MAFVWWGVTSGEGGLSHVGKPFSGVVSPGTHSTYQMNLKPGFLHDSGEISRKKRRARVMMNILFVTFFLYSVK